MRITIVGAGNVGTQLAVHCAEKGHIVTIFNSRPDKISKTLSIVDENNKVIHTGRIERATDDDKSAFANAELIFVTVPAFLMKEYSDRIEPYANCYMKICLVPGTGGGECAFKRCFEKGATIFGVQRVPSVARLVEYGKTVKAIGYREEMCVASIPKKEAKNCSQLIKEIIGIKCSVLPSYLNITLTPSNPVLHTARLKNLFGDYHKGVIYEKVPLFYEDWNIETSILLLACDDEVQNICKALNQFDLSYVKSLRIHYDSSDASSITNKISSIRGFKGLTSPTVSVKGGYKPDFSSRYFTADFSFGLAILVQIADMVEVEVPNMKNLLEWYQGLVGKHKEFCFCDYGIVTLKDFVDFYSR